MSMEHDSLEDYLELSEKISRDANKVKGVGRSVRKREECERKALGIVQLLLERNVCPDIFLKSIVYLTPSYYEDVSEERALLQLCGYPLCRKKILKPKNRYSICNKYKKVYDLNEYGNFCSIFCFNANNHIKSQILDSPLWLRDLDDIPTFSLLVNKDSYAAGIDIQSKKVTKSNEFTTISTFAELSLHDVDHINFSVSAIDEKHHRSSKKINRSELPIVVEDGTEDVENINDKPEEKKLNSNSGNIVTEKEKTTDLHIKIKGQKEVKESNDKIPGLRPTCTDNYNNNLRKSSERTGQNQCSEYKSKLGPQLKDLRAITDKIKRKNQKPIITMIDPLPLKTKRDVLHLQENKHENQSESMKNKSLIELKFSSKDSGSTIENGIMNIFKSWVSLETLIFVHGENTIKEILDVNKLSEHFESLKISQLEIDEQYRYISICRRLCEQEIFEEKIDSLLVKNKLKLPDYKQLKRESKEFNSKVSTFFTGDLHETKDSNFGTIEEKQSVEGSTYIPLDDVNSQNTLRQQILLKTLKSSIELFLDYLQYDSTSVLTELTELVKSFKLNAENIVFKLIIRNYLGLICLKILALKNMKLSEALKKTEFIELENSVFQQLPGKKEVSMKCLQLIYDVDNFIETYVKSIDR